MWLKGLSGVLCNPYFVLSGQASLIVMLMMSARIQFVITAMTCAQTCHLHDSNPLVGDNVLSPHTDAGMCLYLFD